MNEEAIRAIVRDEFRKMHFPTKEEMKAAPVVVPELTEAILGGACGGDLANKADSLSSAFRDLSRMQYRRGWEDLASRLRTIGPGEVVVEKEEFAELLDLVEMIQTDENAFDHIEDAVDPILKRWEKRFPIRPLGEMLDFRDALRSQKGGAT